ncbi:UDP-glucose dehydrogenase family protein [Gordonia sp. NPDC003424]
MKITVIGCGYLGATHAACMAELGHDVLGIDVDADKIARLQSGEVPFFEPGLEDVLRRNISAGRLRFTTDYHEVAAFASVHFLGVGTPQKARSFAADLSHVESATDALIPLLRGDHLVIGKSTVPVGTASALAQRISALAAPGSRIELAWNPEFLREGFAVEDTLEPDRLVLGTDPGDIDSTAERVVSEVYRPILEAGVPFIRTDWATAELVKVSANAFLATKISFINAISEVCEIVDADVTTLADAIGYDQRIGRRFLNAGLGFGGGCLPKDIRGFMARAEEVGAAEAVGFLREVDSINMRRRVAMVELVSRACGGHVLGRNIAVLGSAFKPESDDVRDSPALNVAAQLALRGACVAVFDPKASINSRRMFPMLSYAERVSDACTDADVVVVATEWAEFVHMTPDELADTVREKVIVDGRRCLDATNWRHAGWQYHALGGPVRSTAPLRRHPLPQVDVLR